nr:hypothetical protein [Romeria gracilis]
MSTVGQRERIIQNRVVGLFRDRLHYDYLGNWETRPNNRNIEPELLTRWLQQQDVSETLIGKTLRTLSQAAALGEGKHLYDANKAVYRLLRYASKSKLAPASKPRPSG